MFIPSIEKQSLAVIRAFQESKLPELLQYLKLNSPFYREWFESHQIDIAAIKTLDDLRSIPTTSKEDLQLRNWDFLCVDRTAIAEYTATSGTLGKPVTIALTQKDLDRLSYNEYLSFSSMGGSAGDVYQLMLTLDRQFMAGIAYYSGIRKMGAGLVRTGPGAPSFQWDTIHRLKTTHAVVVPSFLLKMMEFAADHGFDPNQSSLKKALCIGENIRNADLSYNSLGKKILSRWNIALFSTYASTEMQTAFTECEAGSGGHHHPELLIVEFLDDNDQPVEAGAIGEVTITTIGVEGMPLLRYRTGDLCTFFEEPCSCGRHTIRISPVIGRKKQMIKLKGTTLYPPALFDVLNEMSMIQDYVLEVFENELGTDELLLYLVVKEIPDSVDARIKTMLQGKLRVMPEIRYLSMADLLKMQFPDPANRKPLKFIDRR